MALTITVRQTRNPLVDDVEYIAFSKVFLPNESDDPYFTICLNDMGFGKAKSAKGFFVEMHLAGYSGQFIGKGIPEQPMCLDSIRMNLSCDEKLGPVLTIVEWDDLEASRERIKDQARLEKKERRAARMKRLLALPWSCVTWVPSLLGLQNEKIHYPNQMKDLKSTVSKAP